MSANPPAQAVVRMWTVYRHPADYPDQYVAREFVIDGRGQQRAAKDPLSVHEDIEVVRRCILWHRPGAVRIERMPADDPVIVETWV